MQRPKPSIASRTAPRSPGRRPPRPAAPGSSGPHRARVWRVPAPGAADRRCPSAAGDGPRRLHAARCGAVGRARESRAPGEWRDVSPLRGRVRRPHGAGAAGRAQGCRGGDESGGRGRALPQPQDGRGAPQSCIPQAGGALTRRARPGLRLAGGPRRVGRRRRGARIALDSVRPCRRRAGPHEAARPCGKWCYSSSGTGGMNGSSAPGFGVRSISPAPSPDISPSPTRPSV